MFSVHRSNVGPALFLGCIAVLCIWEGSTYELGTLRDMGPGFFPVSLGVVLFILALLIAVERAEYSIDQDKKSHWDQSRWPKIYRQLVAVGAVLGGIGLFTLFLSHLGLIPAAIAIIVISGLAHPKNGLGSLLFLALASVIFVWFVFVVTLGIPFELIKV